MPTKYKGYMGTVIQIDLTTRAVTEYPWSDKERRLFIGGKTMAAKIIGDTVSADTEPFSEGNVIVVSTGPFTGSGCPSTSRFNMSTWSPGDNSRRAARVSSGGSVDDYGNFVLKDDRAVRPAMWINLGV